MVGCLLISIGVYGRTSSIVINLPIIGGILACGVILILISLIGLAGAVKHHQVTLFFVSFKKKYNHLLINSSFSYINTFVHSEIPQLTCFVQNSTWLSCSCCFWYNSPLLRLVWLWIRTNKSNLRKRDGIGYQTISKKKFKIHSFAAASIQPIWLISMIIRHVMRSRYFSHIFTNNNNPIITRCHNVISR